MAAYTSQPFDNFERISRKFYGSALGIRALREANPGLVEPIEPGTPVIIPSQPDVITDQSQRVPASSIDETAILINGKVFRYWSSISITQAIDAPAAVSFDAPFEQDNVAFREVFRPFSYQDMAITVGGQRLFTGIMVDVSPDMNDQAITVSASGYSLPAVLQDVMPPVSAWPLEFAGMTLRDIAKQLLLPFGIGVEFRGSAGAAFEQVAMRTTDKIWAFLVKLAQQRNFVLSDTPSGALRFWRSVEPGQPVARLRQGEPPLLSVTPSFSSQSLYSHITAVEPPKSWADGSAYTVKNKTLTGVLRPHTFVVPDAEGGDLVEAAEAKAGRMYSGAISYDIEVPTWRDPQGDLWQPNKTITITAPGAMIYTEYEFLIRSVTLSRDDEKLTAKLNLVLPGSFSGKQPESLPWD